MNGANTQQTAFKICDHYWNMNVLSSGGDNWYPAIIGSKAVLLKIKRLIIFVLQNTAHTFLLN